MLSGIALKTDYCAPYYARLLTVTVLRIVVLALAFRFPLPFVLAPFVLVLLAITRLRVNVDGLTLLKPLEDALGTSLQC